MSPRFTQPALLLAAVLAALAACSSNSASGNDGASCLANPTLCPSGQTCWPTSASVFACVPSAPGVVFGASCVEKIGIATCSDGMLCDATSSDGDGVCTYYCGPSAPCPAGYACDPTSVAGNGGASISICRLPAPAPVPTSEGGLPVIIYEDAGQPDAEISIPPGETTDASPVQQ